MKGFEPGLEGHVVGAMQGTYFQTSVKSKQRKDTERAKEN